MNLLLKKKHSLALTLHWNNNINMVIIITVCSTPELINPCQADSVSHFSHKIHQTNQIHHNFDDMNNTKYKLKTWALRSWAASTSFPNHSSTTSTRSTSTQQDLGSLRSTWKQATWALSFSPASYFPNPSSTTPASSTSNKNLSSEIKSGLLCLGKLLPKPLVLITKVGHQETSLLQSGIGISGFFDQISHQLQQVSLLGIHCTHFNPSNPTHPLRPN